MRDYMREYSDLEIAENYERHAANWLAHALTLDKSAPEAAFHVRDYGLHCETMAQIFRLRHLDSLVEA